MKSYGILADKMYLLIGHGWKYNGNINRTETKPYIVGRKESIWKL